MPTAVCLNKLTVNYSVAAASYFFYLQMNNVWVVFNGNEWWLSIPEAGGDAFHHEFKSHSFQWEVVKIHFHLGSGNLLASFAVSQLSSFLADLSM